MDNQNKSQCSINLPADLCAAAERLIDGTRFRTVEEFLAFIVRELTATDSAPIEERERHVIEQRLRDLGYL
jgi:hypothetical protein